MKKEVSKREFLKLSAFASAAAILPFAHADAYKIIDLFPQRRKEATSYQNKISNFDSDFHDDFILDPKDFQLLKSCRDKLRTLLRYVGFGNFNLINLSTAAYIMQNKSRLEYFTKDERIFISSLFELQAKELGFYGDQIFKDLWTKVDKQHTIKIPGTGHYIYKGKSFDTYNNIIGKMDTLILTSGVRSVVKQMYLFYNKAVSTNGNLSRASRSIAPVGYSYHGVGDFDVGIRGWGSANFTDRFATTDEFRELMRAGYMRLRYDSHNPFGVRFEPWHVKVV